MGSKVYASDRFIPWRSLIDFDTAYGKLNEEQPEMDGQVEMDASSLYKNQKRLELLRQLDKIVRMNERIFKISPFTSAEEKVHPSVVRLWPCQPRKKPMIQDLKILDLPDFNCDFHVNPIDWGPNDVLATSVGNKVIVGRNLDRFKVTNDTVFEYDEDRATAVSWSPDGRHLAFGSETGVLAVWYTAAESLALEDMCCFQRTCTITVIHWHPDGMSFAWGCIRGRLSVRSIVHNILIAKVDKAHNGYICGLKFSPKGDYLCSSGQDGYLRIWKGTNYHPYMEIEMANPSRAIAWHPWRSGLLAVGEGPPAPGSLSLWNVNTAEMLFLKKLPPNSVITALNFNRITGELVFSQSVRGDRGEKSDVFVLGNPQYVTDSITNIPGSVSTLMWNADSSKLGAASSDETFRIWNFLKPARCKRPFSRIHEDLSSLALKKFKCSIR